jgi:LCP family protein required for cell wall assembly
MSSSYMPAPHEFLRDLGDDSHRKPDKGPRRRIHWKRIFVTILLILITLVIAAAGYIVYNIAGISKRPFSLTGLASDNGRTNVLVLGVGDPGHAGQDLSDTNMVISFDAKTKQVAEISVPRDLRVNIPGYGYSKINAANAVGGSDLARQVVSTTLSIPINYVITTNFTGLQDMVNAVGGIDVNVKTELIDPEYPCASNQWLACGLDIKPGLQHMDGATVLEYVRCRKGTCGNDFGRAARQQEVINLVRQKAISYSILLHPSRFKTLSTAVRTNLTTDLSGTDMVQLALLFQQQKGQPIQLVLSTAPDSYLVDAYGSSDLVPADGTFAAIQAKVQGIFGN